MIIENTLNSLLERRAESDSRNDDRDVVKRAGVATRARIEEVFSRQAKVSARLRPLRSIARAE